MFGNIPLPLAVANTLPTPTGVELFSGFFLWLAPAAIMLMLLILLFYYDLGAPMRRQKNARVLLDVIETSIQMGARVEHTLQVVSNTRDPMFSVRFHWLAALLERGDRLVQAMEKVPGLVPPQITAILRVGEELGDLRRVLPACRQTLSDGVSQSRALLNYQMVLVFVLNPIIFAALPIIVKTLPGMQSLISGLGISAWYNTIYFAKMFPLIMLALWCLSCVLYLGSCGILDGPFLGSWLFAGGYPLHNWISYHVPWRRKRLQRDCSTMLAVLLDAGVPEEKAVTLAAASTANRCFIQNARKVVDALRQGHPLTEALRQLDDTGEFHWRLTNACHGQSGFQRALAAWQETLEARAFQQEQAASQFMTTSMLIVNGALVATMAGAVFYAIAIMETGWLKH